MRVPTLVLSACAAFAAAGCSGANANLRASSPSMANIHQAPSAAEKVTEFDLNRDKHPDDFLYKVTAKTEDGREYERLVRREMDLNFDGRIDVSRIYDDHEQLSEEKLDLDFDGKIDQVNYYEKGVLVRKERDVGNSGRINQWLFFEKGKIVRKERDTNGDGRVDQWEYWEGDQVDRVGEDLDGDGKVDRWSKSTSASVDPS